VSDEKLWDESPTSRHLDSFSNPKNAGNLLIPIFKKLGSFGFELFWGCRHNWGRSRLFGMTSSGPEKKFKRQFLCFFFKKNYEKIRIFKALVLPYCVCGWQVMA